MNPYRVLKNGLLLTAIVLLGVAQAMGAPVLEALEWMRLSVGEAGDGNSYAIMAAGSVTAFKEAFGAYYQPRGQNMARLKQLLYQDRTAFDRQFNVMPISGDVIERGLMAHTRVLQSFKPRFSPLGELSGTPRKSQVRRVKINTATTPDQLANTWLGFLTTEGGRDPNINRTSWPFVRWYMERYLVPQAMQDQYDEAFLAIFAEPADNDTPSAAGTNLDGLHLQINQDVDDSLITPISTGALEEDPEAFVEQIAAFAEQINNRYRGQQMVINMHDTFAQRFAQGIEESNNLKPLEILGTQMYTLPRRTNIKVLGHFNWLQGVGGAPSEKIFCTPAPNLWKVIRTGNKEGGPFDVQVQDYKVKFFADWHLMYTYDDPRVMFVNDAELEYGMD